MNIIDVIIVLLLLMGGVIGFKRGVLKQAVMTIGSVLLFILAFHLKNPLSSILYEKLPFFKFDGVFAGVTSLNILIYEILAFVIVSGLLAIILHIIIWVTGLIEKALDFTIILAIPSKILGFILGIVESYIIIFFVFYILAMPVFNIKMLNESGWRNKILNNSPILTKVAKKSVDTFNEIYALKDEFLKSPNSAEFNRRNIEIMLKNDIVTVENVEKLVELKKIEVPGINNILDKYR